LRRTGVAFESFLEPSNYGCVVDLVSILVEDGAIVRR
jgi:hypothetical protein